ncbi:envelope stress response membrane protein PspB [Veronia pacifica]|uniref:Phage shock protein B n=1 Tax=Veronia pacifica TaxID=1080227 RepID=A0A1C3EM39_9GAMM|nr:envelope stress response membrane protein PspB [Veronia pacifica]ODA34317.1 phage shock protein B [Veronia pacifica]
MTSFFLMIPLAAFVVFVLPIWLVLHYKSKRQVGQGLSTDEFDTLHSLTKKAEALQTRVHSLERILDVEAPEWRERR